MRHLLHEIRRSPLPFLLALLPVVFFAMIVAEAMQITKAEGNASWLLHRDCPASMRNRGDGHLKLVLQHAHAYRNEAEDRAAKALLKSNVLQFAQVENRLGLALRLQMASAVTSVLLGGETPGDAGGQVVALAPNGAEHGGPWIVTIQMTAKVSALDHERSKATLQLEDGIIRTAAVCPGVDLIKSKVGARVRMRTAEMLAIAVGNRRV